MASHLDAPDDSTDDGTRTLGEPEDPIDEQLLSALESQNDEAARYHLREALQLQIAEMQGT